MGAAMSSWIGAGAIRSGAGPKARVLILTVMLLLTLLGLVSVFVRVAVRWYGMIS
jgi:hypothetical protein